MDEGFGYGPGGSILKHSEPEHGNILVFTDDERSARRLVRWIKACGEYPVVLSGKEKFQDRSTWPVPDDCQRGSRRAIAQTIWRGVRGGGRQGDRTLDLGVANAALSHLS